MSKLRYKIKLFLHKTGIRYSPSIHVRQTMGLTREQSKEIMSILDKKD